MEISKIFHDRQSKPLGTATWWIEHLLEHKVTNEAFHSYAVNLNWFVFYSLDAICTLLGILVVIILIVKTLLGLYLRRRNKLIYNKLKRN